MASHGDEEDLRGLTAPPREKENLRGLMASHRLGEEEDLQGLNQAPRWSPEAAGTSRRQRDGTAAVKKSLKEITPTSTDKKPYQLLTKPNFPQD